MNYERIMNSTSKAQQTAPWRRHLTQDDGRVPAALRESLDALRPIIVVGRNSYEASDGRRDAADDLYGATEKLEQLIGVNFESLLPTKAELAEMLRLAKTEHSKTVEGKRFTNSYVVIDRAAEHGVVFLVSTGSGHSLDQNDRQPFTEYLRKLVLNSDAAAIATKRFDRAFRSDDIGPMMAAMGRRHVWMITNEQVSAPGDEAWPLLFHLKASQSASEASGIPRKMRLGMRSKSGSRMANGRVAYAGLVAPPPGFNSVRLRTESGGKGQRVLHLDDPQHRFPDRDVAFGQPEIFVKDAAGKDHRANQVEIVKFILSHVGKPGWRPAQVAREAIRRGYSTSTLRSRNGPGAITNHHKDTARLVRLVLQHIDLYETGRFVAPVGSGVDPIEIENCFPIAYDDEGEVILGANGEQVTGVWAQPEDFARLRRWRREQAELSERRSALTFSGLDVTFNGVPCRTRGQVRADHPDGSRYYFVLDENQGKAREKRPPRSGYLGATELAQSIALGLRSFVVDGRNLTEVNEAASSHPMTDTLVARLAGLTSEIDAVETKATAIVDQISQVDDSGVPVLKGDLLHRVTLRFDELTEEKEVLARQQGELQRDLDDHRAQSPEVGDTSDILRLVSSLRSPTSRAYSDVWRASIRRLEFRTEATTYTDNRTVRQVESIKWCGEVILHDATSGDQLVAPFHGEVVRGQ